MTCLTIQRLLPAYLDQELSDAERTMVEEHLATCADCRSELQAFETTQQYTGTAFRAMATASGSPPEAWQRLQARLAREGISHTVAQAYNTAKGITSPFAPHPEEDPTMNVVTTNRSPAVEPTPPATMSERMQRGLAITAVASVLGVLGNLLLRATPWGINVVLWCGAMVLGTLGLLRWQGIRAVGAGRGMIVPMLLFAACMAWRDSGVLFFLNAVGLGIALALAAFRTIRGELWRAGLVEYGAVVGRGVLALLQAPVQVLLRDIQWHHLPRGAWVGVLQAVARGVAIAIPILVVFGGLLMTADVIFADYLSTLFEIDIPALLSHLFLTGVFTWLSIAFLYQTVESDDNPLARLTRPRIAKLGVIEMGIVLGALDLLFLAFVTIQFRYFFGGAEYLIQQAVGLTYAEYARRGFFELVTVAALLLPLLLGTHWLMAGTDQSKASRRLFTGLASIAVVMIFVMITSGLMRMATYVQVFGLTESRVYSTAFMGWLAILFGWFALTVLRGHRPRFAGGALLTGFALILVLNILNPDGLIVRVNLARHVASDITDAGMPSGPVGPVSLWDDGRLPRATFDPIYLIALSGDAVPDLVASLRTLDPDHQCYIATQLLQRWTPPTEVDWRTWNWGRVQAWQAVQSARVQVSGCPSSPGVPEPVTALRRTWFGTDTITGQPITLRFDDDTATLSTTEGEFKGQYFWISSERLLIQLGRYLGVGAETASLPCPTLPPVFDMVCSQQIASGYPAPLAATPAPRISDGPYPAPLPTEVVTDALYQGIAAEYEVVITNTTLTLTSPTGVVQSFTATP